jgi:hypothetical protein
MHRLALVGPFCAMDVRRDYKDGLLYRFITRNIKITLKAGPFYLADSSHMKYQHAGSLLADERFL